MPSFQIPVVSSWTISSSLAGGVPAIRGAFNGQFPVACAGSNQTDAPSNWRPLSISPESLREVWHIPHIATPSTMYLPRATRLSFVPDFGVCAAAVFDCGCPITLSVASPAIITTHETDRRSRALAFQNRILNVRVIGCKP